MREVQSGQSNTVISVAAIAADLHMVNQIAWNVSITAKNAMIISAQAGEKARGFAPITRFIDEIAQSAIESTRHVEYESIRLTRLSAHYLRTRDAYGRFDKVTHQAQGARFLDSFLPKLRECSQRVQDEAVQLYQQLQLLNEYMQELDQNMGAALAVASVCRIEASRAGEYRDNLGVVADSLETAAHSIKALVKQGLERVLAIHFSELQQE
jgi:hypothetical protein